MEYKTMKYKAMKYETMKYETLKRGLMKNAISQKEIRRNRRAPSLVRRLSAGVLTAVSLLLLSGCGNRQEAAPYDRYLYYLKGGDLMRLDLEKVLAEPGETPEAERIFADAGSLVSFTDGSSLPCPSAESGKATVFSLPQTISFGAYGPVQKLIYVDHETGQADEIVEDISEAYFAGDTVYYQSYGDEPSPVEGADLYRFVPGGEDELLAEDTDVVNGLSDGVLFYTAVDGVFSRDAYLVSGDGTHALEQDVSDGGYVTEYAGKRVYTREDEDGHWLFGEVAEDGTVTWLLTEEDQADDFYICRTDGGILYTKMGPEPEIWYRDGTSGERRCLTEGAYLYDACALPAEEESPEKGKEAFLVCNGELTQYSIVVDGVLSPIAFPGISEEAMEQCWLEPIVVEDVLYLKLGNAESGSTRLYRVQLGETGYEGLEEVWEGYEIRPLRNPDEEGKGFLYEEFFSPEQEGGQDYALCLDGERLTGGSVADDYASLLDLPEGEGYEDQIFFLQSRDDALENDPALAPELIRLDTQTGEQEVLKTDVFFCEPRLGGIVMLADASFAEPYSGELYVYDGEGVRHLDSGVNLLFPHGKNALAFDGSGWSLTSLYTQYSYDYEELTGREPDPSEAAEAESLFGIVENQDGDYFYKNEKFDLSILFPGDGTLRDYQASDGLTMETSLGSQVFSLLYYAFPSGQYVTLSAEETLGMTEEEYIAAGVRSWEAMGFELKRQETVTLGDGREYQLLEVSAGEGSDLSQICCLRKASEDYFLYFNVVALGGNEEELEALFRSVGTADGTVLETAFGPDDGKAAVGGGEK